VRVSAVWARGFKVSVEGFATQGRGRVRGAAGREWAEGVRDARRRREGTGVGWGSGAGGD
jgi:hypothetical protein